MKALAGLTVALVAVASAAPAQDQESSPASGSAITLAAAVETTLRDSFNLQQARESVDNRRGAWQRSSGAFDKLFFIDGDFTFVKQELLRGGRDSEVKRRAPLEYLGGWPTTPPFSFPGWLDVAADEIQDFLNVNGASAFEDCQFGESRNVFDLENPDGVGDQGGSFLDRYRQSTVTLCLDEDGNLRSLVPANGVGFTGSILFSDTPALLEILDGLDAIDEQTRRELEEAIREEALIFVDALRQRLRQGAADLREARERLGNLPDVEELLDLKLDIGLQRKFRNGISLTSSVALVGTEDNFEGKGFDPRDGDALSPNTFRTSFGLRFVFPLGKGRGRAATAGPERAAEAILSSEQRLFVHEASREATATVDAYWKLAAAQERAALLRSSAETQAAIRDATRAMVDADELPGAELWRAEARYAELLARVASAERSLIDARMDLAQAMGQEPESLSETPLAADSLGEGSEFAPDRDAWTELAYAERQDLAATAEATRASRILERTASANLRRQFDFFANVSYTGYHENFTRFQRIWDFDGYRDAVEGRGFDTLPGEEPDPAVPQVGLSGPSYTVGFRFTLPTKNRTARGQLVQAQASRAQSQIAERDLKRTIELRLQDLLPALERKQAQQDRLREVIANQQITVDASLELYRLGDITLIDMETTEEQLTNSQLQLLDVRLEIALLENQVRFETGQLLEGAAEPEAFEPAALRLAKRSAPAAAQGSNVAITGAIAGL